MIIEKSILFRIVSIRTEIPKEFVAVFSSVFSHVTMASGIERDVVLDEHVVGSVHHIATLIRLPAIKFEKFEKRRSDLIEFTLYFEEYG